jgi:hypothetical protein
MNNSGGEHDTHEDAIVDRSSEMAEPTIVPSPGRILRRTSRNGPTVKTETVIAVQISSKLVPLSEETNWKFTPQFTVTYIGLRGSLGELGRFDTFCHLRDNKPVVDEEPAPTPASVATISRRPVPRRVRG